MTAEDVWKLFAETDRVLKQSSLEADRRFQEIERVLKESSLEFDRRSQEIDRQFKETDRQFKETDRKIQELGRQIGGLGNKFGSFTEGLVMPSMERLLRQRFGMTSFAPRIRVRQGDDEIELDLLSYANGELNSAYVVEIKSHLEERAIFQMLTLLERFPRFFPEHRGKALYGILAYIQGSKEVRQKVLDAGLYLASIHDETFHLEVPRGFAPRRFDTWSP